MKRLLILLLIPLLLTGGCGFGKREEKNDGTKWAQGAMLRVGDLQIDYREGLVYLDATRKDYERYYGTDIWNYRIKSNGDTLGITVKEQVLEAIIYVKIVCSMADGLNVYLSDDELKDVDLQAEEYVKSLEGSEILKMGVNTDVVRRIYSDNLLARKVFERATLNIDTNISNETAGQHHFYSIAVRNSKIGPDGERVDYSEAEREAIREQLREIKESWENSSDMYSFAKTKTEDLSMLDLMIGIGDLEDKNLEAALMKLRDGAFSDIVESGNFFYVFYCRTAFDVDATQEKKEEMIEKRREEAFEALYEGWREATDVEVNSEIWDSIDVFTVKIGDE